MSEVSENTIFEHGGCFFLMLGLRSAVSEISENTIFEHGACFFFMLGLRSAVCEISENTIFTVVVFFQCLVCQLCLRSAGTPFLSTVVVFPESIAKGSSGKSFEH